MRDTLIVDDDDNDDNNCEQSDMVALILNLAFISEEFIHQLEFGPGISTQLKALLKAHTHENEEMSEKSETLKIN